MGEHALEMATELPPVSSQRARILLLSVAAVMGGAEVYLVRLAELLAAHADLYAVCANPHLARELSRLRVTVHQVPCPMGSRAQRVLKYPMLLIGTLWALARHRIDVCHISGYQAAFLLPLARMNGCRAFVTPHHLPGGLARRLYGIFVRCAHRVVNVSATVDREHHALAPSVQTSVVRNWVPEIPSAMPQRRPDSTKRVVFVGRLVASKGLPELIEAIRQLRGGVSLQIAGEGPLQAEYERISEGLPVEFCGYYPDLAKLYAGADALIVPSHGPEGSCLVALEAMTQGLPCILSDLPVYREIAENGRTALVVPVGDVNALAEAIRALIADRAGAHRLATSAFEMMQRRYSPAAAALEYRALFGLGEVSASTASMSDSTVQCQPPCGAANS